MFFIKSLDDLLKVSGATLEGTVPIVAQFEAVSTTCMAGCRRRWRLREARGL